MERARAEQVVMGTGREQKHRRCMFNCRLALFAESNLLWCLRFFSLYVCLLCVSCLGIWFGFVAVQTITFDVLWGGRGGERSGVEGRGAK